MNDFIKANHIGIRLQDIGYDCIDVDGQIGICPFGNPEDAFIVDSVNEVEIFIKLQEREQKIHTDNINPYWLKPLISMAEQGKHGFLVMIKKGEENVTGTVVVLSVTWCSGNSCK